MNLIKAAVLGLVQGITEFLPISSSAHLVFLEKFLGLIPDISFAVLLHFATLLAVAIFLRKDLENIIIQISGKKGISKSRDLKVLLLLAVGSLPTLVVVILWKNKIESVFSQPKLISIFLVLTGLVLYLSQQAKNASKGIRETTLVDGFMIGVAQAVAILPGISRSGMTVVCGLLLGLEREWAVRYSFLLAIPVISGGALWNFIDNINAFPALPVKEYLVGTIVAFISGYGSLRLLLGIVKRYKLNYFAYYCVLLGSATYFL